MARKYNSELIALYVIVSDITIFGPGPPLHIDKTKQEAQRYLDKIKHKLDQQMNNDNDENNSNNKIKFKSEITESNYAAYGIVDFAEKENCDVIVIGTRGRTGFKRLLLGSVANGVVQHAHCPVLLIR